MCPKRFSPITPYISCEDTDCRYNVCLPEIISAEISTRKIIRKMGWKLRGSGRGSLLLINSFSHEYRVDLRG